MNSHKTIIIPVVCSIFDELYGVPFQLNHAGQFEATPDTIVADPSQFDALINEAMQHTIRLSHLDWRFACYHCGYSSAHKSFQAAFPPPALHPNPARQRLNQTLPKTNYPLIHCQHCLRIMCAAQTDRSDDLTIFKCPCGGETDVSHNRSRPELLPFLHVPENPTCRLSHSDGSSDCSSSLPTQEAVKPSPIADELPETTNAPPIPASPDPQNQLANLDSPKGSKHLHGHFHLNLSLMG